MDLGLKGKTAIVTGGSRGLGEAICRILAAEGVNIVLNYVSDDARAKRAAEEITKAYTVPVLLVRADVADEAQAAAVFEKTAQAFGSADILVNNAGICPVRMIMDTSYAEWQQVMSVNAGGVFLMSRAFAKQCVAANKGGRIINIASQTAFNGSKNGKTHYASSKGAVVSFTVSFAKEVAAYGIYVNAVSPGMVLTDMTRDALTASGGMEQYKKNIPSGRLSEPLEVAKSVAFLASDASGCITGSIFDVSGGMMGR
jgi:3-oxoacyl-[acyl-carrier protein] reductase